jgi:hypothetical protein
MMLDLNPAVLASAPLNEELNALIEAAEPPSPNERQYLGASQIGSECLRRIQFDWWVDPVFPSRVRDIFSRGHSFEELSRRHLIRVGFRFASEQEMPLGFTAAKGLFRGHVDGVLLDGPKLPGLIYPAVWEHKCVKAQSWRNIERHGLLKDFEYYARQVAIYQAYLDLTNPALFTALNADTCQRLSFLVPFDARLAQSSSDRAVAVIEATRAGELLPRVTSDSDDWRCKICSHRVRCWVTHAGPA